MTENEVLIKTPEEAIETIKSNMPTSGYQMLRESLEMAITALKEVQQYREIGTVEECREAVEKQISMKIKEIHVDEYFCPACGSENNCDQGVVGDKYCPMCGYAIYQDLEGMEDERD